MWLWLGQRAREGDTFQEIYRRRSRCTHLTLIRHTHCLISVELEGSIKPGDIILEYWNIAAEHVFSSGEDAYWNISRGEMQGDPSAPRLGIG